MYIAQDECSTSTARHVLQALLNARNEYVRNHSFSLIFEYDAVIEAFSSRLAMSLSQETRVREEKTASEQGGGGGGRTAEIAGGVTRQGL
jgi:hypothetical protein